MGVNIQKTIRTEWLGKVLQAKFQVPKMFKHIVQSNKIELEIW